MHVSVGFKWKRDEQIRAGNEKLEAAAIGVVRPALIHHTKVVSAALLCGERNLQPPSCSTHTNNPLPSCSLCWGLGQDVGQGCCLSPPGPFFLKARTEMDLWDATRTLISQRLEEHYKTAGVRDVWLSAL